MEPPTQIRPTVVRQTTLWLVLGVWLATTIVAYTWFTQRYQRAFVDDFAAFTTFDEQAPVPKSLLDIVAGPSVKEQVVLLHIRDRDCPCDRFNAPHLERITAAYDDRQLRVVNVDIDRPGNQLAREVAAWLPRAATPAAVVLDGDRLAYYGPYSAGVGCLTGRGTFVERAIERALDGTANPQINLMNVGCYCAWRNLTATTAIRAGERLT